MRVLCNGKTSAFQADDRGSIPLTRSIADEPQEAYVEMIDQCDERLRVCEVVGFI